MIRIDSTDYNVPVTSLRRIAEFKTRFSDMTEDGILRRKLVGVYFHYQLTLGATLDTAEYAALWDKLTEATEFHTVTVPDESGDFTFTAYFDDVGDELLKIQNSKNYFNNLTVNFIAKAPTNTGV